MNAHVNNVNVNVNEDEMGFEVFHFRVSLVILMQKVY